MSLDLPFFYDNILLSSKIADQFYLEGFGNFIPDKNIDTGHPVLWPVLLAGTWKMLGRNLFSGHFLSLLFIIPAILLYLKIAVKLINEHYLWIAAAFLIIEPTWFAQSTMVGPDVPIVTFFLLGIYAVIYDYKKLLIIATIVLSLLSVRGAILSFLLFTHLIIWNNQKADLKSFLKDLLYFIPCFLVFVGWITWHYINTGVLIEQPDSAWSAHHQFVNATQFFKNIGIIIWRFIDFGRIGLYLILFIILLKEGFKNRNRKVLMWILLPVMLLVLIVSIRTSPILHRYFMVYFILLSIYAAKLISEIESTSFRNIALSIAILSCLLGQFLVYPDTVAQGWDGSLAHLPYFHQRDKMLNYIENQNIHPDQIITTFPNLNGDYYSDLHKQPYNFQSIHENELFDKEYVWQSNVFNDFSDEQIKTLQTKAILVKEFKNWNVYTRLYKSTINN